MPRPPAFTDDQRLCAPREVFLERGVLATTEQPQRHRPRLGIGY
jgi:hypothetical protein